MGLLSCLNFKQNTKKGLRAPAPTITLLFLGSLAATLVGCSAKELKPQARNVIVSRHAPSKNCRILGNVVGEQGGSFTGGWTSNRKLMIGAMNDLKNQAYEMGGNYVVLEESKAGQTSSGTWYSSSSQQTDVTNMGTVYRCPKTKSVALID